ncbi:hypothetical protein AU458_RS01190 [Escherichia coli]
MFEFPEESFNFIDPTDDGYRHINIYSKARTKLGRDLSNFSSHSFTLEPYGWFPSVETFYFWFLTGQKHDDLRKVSGAAAKAAAKKYMHDRIEMTDDCISIIQDAICAKIIQNPELAERLRKSKLPFYHYYVYGGKVVDVSDEHDWFVKTFEYIRTVLKENYDG